MEYNAGSSSSLTTLIGDEAISLRDCFRVYPCHAGIESSRCSPSKLSVDTVNLSSKKSWSLAVNPMAGATRFQRRDAPPM